MGVILIFLVLAWLACTAVTVLFAFMIDHFAARRWWGRTPRALWRALFIGHATNLLLFWSPFTVDPHKWLFFGSTLAVTALLLWPFARRRARAAV